MSDKMKTVVNSFFLFYLLASFFFLINMSGIWLNRSKYAVVELDQPTIL